MIRTLLILLVVSLLTFSASASQLLALPFGSFELHIPDRLGSGPVSIRGTQNESGITGLSVQAFGRRTELRREHLAQLRNVKASNISVSYEHGYPEVGGRTVYVVLRFGTLSDATCIAVNEKGGIRITPNDSCISGGT